MDEIEKVYRAHLAELGGPGRVARGAELLRSARQVFRSRVLREMGPMPEAQLRVEVALRMYAKDKALCDMIRRRFAHG